MKPFTATLRLCGETNDGIYFYRRDAETLGESEV
jgi:hypothetical protein